MPMRPPMSASALVLMAAGAGLVVGGVPDGLNETAIDAAITFGDYEGGRLWTLREGVPDGYPVTQRMRGYEHFV